MWTAQSVSDAKRDSMPTDPKDTVQPLTHASILVEVAGEARRFRVYSAVLLPPRQRRIRVRFEGPKGSVTLELPLVTFWQLTEVFHDRSVRTDE
jgi:hypothetical protein